MEQNDNGSTTRRAVHVLRSMIFRGELGPGSDHLEGDLADRLGMSRTPVREAALTLEAQGLVQVRPRKGVRVLAVSPEDMRDIYDVLTELESLSAANAASLGYERSDLRVLADAINAMDDALMQEDRNAWAEADDLFHAELVRLGQNKRVENIVAMMEDQVRRAKQMTLHIRPLPSASNKDHRDVLGAIAAGDASAARRIHHRHRSESRDMLLSLLHDHRMTQL